MVLHPSLAGKVCVSGVMCGADAVNKTDVNTRPVVCMMASYSTIKGCALTVNSQLSSVTTAGMGVFKSIHRPK